MSQVWPQADTSLLELQSAATAYIGLNLLLSTQVLPLRRIRRYSLLAP